MSDTSYTPLTAQSQTSIIDLITAIKIGNQNAAQLVQTIKASFAAQSANTSKLAVAYNAATASASGCTLIDPDAKYCIQVSVTTVPTSSLTPGKLFDSATVANAGAANVFALIPSSGTLVINWPLVNGLVIQPSSQGQVVSVSYV